MPCKRCGSFAINHNHHGRDGTDAELCDVCYWRNRYSELESRIAEVSAQYDRARDIAYAAGMLSGWNYCSRGADEEFNEHRMRLTADGIADPRAQRDAEIARIVDAMESVAGPGAPSSASVPTEPSSPPAPESAPAPESPTVPASAEAIGLCLAARAALGMRCGLRPVVWNMVCAGGLVAITAFRRTPCATWLAKRTAIADMLTITWRQFYSLRITPG